MKIIRRISKQEMLNKHPDLMAALDDPRARYCMKCDGLRIHDGFICTVCGARYAPYTGPYVEPKK